LNPNINKTNRRGVDKFSKEQAVEIGNFFLDKVMGPAALIHLNELIRFYNSPNEQGPDKGISAPDTPQRFRPCFGAFSRVDATQLGKSKAFAHLEKTVNGQELLKH
jgi:hypothetical protein